MTSTPAPFQLEQDSTGRLRLTGTGAVSNDTESELAAKLNAAFDYAAAAPTAMQRFLKPFRDIAELGLTGTTRDIGKANEKLAALNLGPQVFAGKQGVTGAAPAPHKGAFTISLSQDEEIFVRRNPSGDEPTDDQLKFATELDRQERLVKSLYRRGEPDPIKTKAATHRALKRLVMAGQLALGERPNVRLGRIATDSILADGLSEYGMTIRRDYLCALARGYLGCWLVGVLVTVLYWLEVHHLNSEVPAALVLPTLNLVLLVVAMAWLAFGAWLSALIRIEPDSPEVIDSIVNETIGAMLRAVSVLGFGFIALLMLHKKAVVFAIGAESGIGFSTATVLSQLSSAVLTGGLLGLGERALPNIVAQNSAKLVAALAPK
jgi:hypothetical protein